MQKQPFKRIYTDNDHYAMTHVADLDNIPYMDSLFSVVWNYLYKDDNVSEDDYEYFDFCMKGRIKPYDFMTLAFYIISASMTEYGEATIEDYIETIKVREGRNEERVIYTSEGSLLVTNASTELQASIVWTAYLYAKIRSDLDGGRWDEIAPMLWGVVQRQLLLVEEAFNKLYIVRNTENALKTFVKHLLTKGSLSKEKHKVQESVPTDSHICKELEVLRRRVIVSFPDLYSEEAEVCWKKLRNNGYVDEWNQPTEKLTNECRAAMASCLAFKLGFEKKKWDILQKYWGCKHMAQDYKDGLESNRNVQFEKEIAELLELEVPSKPPIQL